MEEDEREKKSKKSYFWQRKSRTDRGGRRKQTLLHDTVVLTKSVNGRRGGLKGMVRLDAVGVTRDAFSVKSDQRNRPKTPDSLLNLLSVGRGSPKRRKSGQKTTLNRLTGNSVIFKTKVRRVEVGRTMRSEQGSRGGTQGKTNLSLQRKQGMSTIQKRDPASGKALRASKAG